MRQFILLVAAFTALTFTSCKKDDNGTNPGPGPAPVTGKLIKKLTKTEGGVATVYTFNYDPTTKRLSSVTSADNSESTIFTYDAAGNVTKVDETEAQFHNIYTYTYANNVPKSATFKSWQRQGGVDGQLHEDDVLTYTVTNNQVSSIHLKMMDGAEVDFALTYTNGNLTNVKSVGNDWYEADFTWGNKKSPYPQMSKWVLDHAGFSLMFAAKNDMVTTSFNFPGTTLDKHISYLHTYDAAGYPITSNNGGGVTLAYEYQ